jgi:hypothetical protein
MKKILASIFLLTMAISLFGQVTTTDKLVIKPSGSIKMDGETRTKFPQVYTQTTQPSGGVYHEGDVWKNTATDSTTTYVYNGAAWTLMGVRAASGGGGGGGGDSTAVLRTDINNLQTLSGRPDGSTHNSTYSGTTIPDNQTTKQNLQSLETAVETKLTDGTGVITSTKILDNTILAVDLNQMSATSGQVLKWNGSAWAPAADATGGGGSGRDSMYIASPDTLVHRNVYGVITKFKLVYSLPADSLAVSSSTLNFYRRGSSTPQAVTLPNPTPAIVSQTATTNTTVTLTTGEIYEVNLSGVSTCNITWASLTSGKQHKIHFQNGTATTLNLPLNTVFLKEDGGTCLLNPIVNKDNTLISGYTTSSIFYVESSTVPLQCVTMNTQYQAVLDYATAQGFTKPSLANQLYQSRLVDSLQSNGIWDSLDVFYSFYTGSIADSNFTRINWKDPTGDDNITAAGGRTFAALTGWNSNGSTGHLNTNWNPSSEGVRYDLNTCSFGAWVVAPGGTGSKYNMGIQVSGGTTRMEENSGGRKFIVNASGETTTTGGVTAGLWHINRAASNVTAGYLNGSDLSTSVSNGNLYLMSLNLSNAPFGSTVSTVKYRYAFAGGNLASKASALYTILNAHNALIN